MSPLTKTQEKMPANGVSRETYVTPVANILEAEDGYVLQAEMPGVNKEGMEITVENNELVITGHRSDPAVKGDPVYRESRPADYRRVFDLDPAIDTEKITAKMEQGILTLTLPKAERVKPRRIAVD